MPFTHRLCATIAATALLAGCSTLERLFLPKKSAPASQTAPARNAANELTQAARQAAIKIDGSYALAVLSIDGSSMRPGLQQIPIAPGPRALVLQPTDGKQLFAGTRRTISMAIAPCTRYQLAATRVSLESSDWDLQVLGTEPLRGCDAALEMKKHDAGKADASSMLVSPAR